MYFEKMLEQLNLDPKLFTFDPPARNTYKKHIDEVKEELSIKEELIKCIGSMINQIIPEDITKEQSSKILIRIKSILIMYT